MDAELHILQSWQTNAASWTKAINTEAIESRKLVTNKAIVDAILHQQPRSFLDVGCGEGWLCRALAHHNVHATGIDAIPALIEAAQQQGHAEFHVCSYQDIADGKFKPGKTFDVIAFNFSLFGNELVSVMLKQLHNYFSSNGSLIIQTLHPLTACGDQPYKDGWREGSWTGFSEDFTDPAPWYFRTLESWITLFSETDYNLSKLVEPLHPYTHRPASVIFTCTPRK